VTKGNSPSRSERLALEAVLEFDADWKVWTARPGSDNLLLRATSVGGRPEDGRQMGNRAGLDSGERRLVGVR
jgi:hypothetical protein